MLINNIGIDLGSDNLHFYIQKDNRFISNKSIIAIDNNKEIISCGEDASKYIEKETENIILKRPVKKGKIEDIELTVEMLNGILKKEKLKKRIINPNILISYDRSLNEVEKNILIETIKDFGCKNIFLMDSITLSCLGMGMEIEKNITNMIIDIGYETTKIGVIFSNDIVQYNSISYGGNTFNEEIIKYVREKYETLIGYSTVEKLKQELNDKDIEVTGRNLITGLPTKLIIKNQDINNCIYKLVEVLVKEIKNILEKISPEMLSDISEKGIVITGGGSLLKGLREKLEERINIPILITKNPTTNIIKGIKIVIDSDIKRANKI